MRDAPDKALLGRCRRGDREALAELLHRHRPLVWSTARRVAGDGAHLEDVVQDTMVAVIESLDRFRGQSKLGTWIAAVACRTALNWVNRQPGAREVALGERPGNPCDDVASAVEHRDTAARLREAIDRLPPDQRAVVHLRHTEGLSVNEIAEALGVPVGTVKSRLHHARRQLRRFALARPPETERR